MELSQLRTFREVADALSFTRASQKLNMTQSAVSHQIKALERELGEPLFIRAKRGVRLTDSGQLALSYAERILEEADALRERIRGDDHEPRGRVRAAAATQAFVHLFARLFESFMRDHDRIELSFRTTVSTEQTVADILNGAADVGEVSCAAPDGCRRRLVRCTRSDRRECGRVDRIRLAAKRAAEDHPGDRAACGRVEPRVAQRVVGEPERAAEAEA